MRGQNAARWLSIRIWSGQDPPAEYRSYCTRLDAFVINVHEDCRHKREPDYSKLIPLVYAPLLPLRAFAVPACRALSTSLHPSVNVCNVDARHRGVGHVPLRTKLSA